MCFAPTIRRCSPPAPRPLRRHHPNGAGGWSPPAWPARESIQLPTAAPTPIRPSSQPATPCPTYFPRYAPPYTILECRFPFWVRSTEPRRSPFSHIHPIHPLNPPLCFLLPSLSFSQTTNSLSHFASSCHYPSCFSFLVSSSFSSLARVLRSLSLPGTPLFPLNMPQGLVVSLGLACRLGQPPLLAPNDPLKRPGRGRHKKKMRRRERDPANGYTKRERKRERERERERRWERKLMSIVPGELEGVWGRNWRPANCFKSERGTCPTFTSTTTSNLPVNIRIVAQLQ